MSETNRDNFSTQVNAKLDEVDPEKYMRRFTMEEGQQAWDIKPTEIELDVAVTTFVQNVIDEFHQMPDNGSS